MYCKLTHLAYSLGNVRRCTVCIEVSLFKHTTHCVLRTDASGLGHVRRRTGRAHVTTSDRHLTPMSCPARRRRSRRKSDHFFACSSSPSEYLAFRGLETRYRAMTPFTAPQPCSTALALLRSFIPGFDARIVSSAHSYYGQSSRVTSSGNTV
jgi:hypothetical protein